MVVVMAVMVAVGWYIAIHHRHQETPVIEQEAYGKGDLLFIHRDLPPPPQVSPPPLAGTCPGPSCAILTIPTPAVEAAEPPRRRRQNICERNGGVKIDTGRSWHCRYPRRS
jgi:hypothetical protein